MPAQKIQFEFNRAKAIEAVLYIAHRIADPTLHSISKLLYFADKTSLENYGRLISGDMYYALQWGPVPTNTLDLMRAAPANGELGFRLESGKEIVPLRVAKLDELSQSDIDSLNIVIDVYGRMPFWQRTEESHDAAWDTAWNNRGTAKHAPMPIEEIAKLLKDGEILIRHLQTQFD